MLTGFPHAVLGARDPEGAPVPARVHPDPGATGYRIDLPEDVTVAGGPASLLVHRHDEKLAKLRFALVRGQLEETGGAWQLVPSEVVDPARAAVRTFRRTRRSTQEYLRRSNLPRPRVDWTEFAAVASAAKPGRTQHQPAGLPRAATFLQVDQEVRDRETAIVERIQQASRPLG